MGEKFTRGIKLIQLKGIIYNRDRVSIRKAGEDWKPEDEIPLFRDAVEKYGDYYVWLIEANSQNRFNITVGKKTK